MDPTTRPEALDTHHKALALNLDPSKYGSLAEIGAGQEVSRWLFRVGGAAGTVARTLSAYDMAVSDDIYGHSSRYVARDRLEAMLSVEYRQLRAQVGTERELPTAFFAFADTVSARNYRGTNLCHGWMGVRFQHDIGAEPSVARLHISLRDDTNLLQQQAVGILGVNLIHAVFFRRESLPRFLESLHEELGVERAEIDHIELEGDGFADVSHVDLPLALVRSGLTPAVVYDASRPTHDPMSTLYKAPLVAERSLPGASPSPGASLLDTATRALGGEPSDARHAPVALYEISLAEPSGAVPTPDDEIRAHIARLGAHGQPVLVTHFRETHRLTDYLRRHTEAPVAYALDLLGLMRIFSPDDTENPEDEMVEVVHRMLSSHVRVLVAPLEVEALAQRMQELPEASPRWSLPEQGMATLDNTEPQGPLRHLHRYLRELGALTAL